MYIAGIMLGFAGGSMCADGFIVSGLAIIAAGLALAFKGMNDAPWPKGK